MKTFKEFLEEGIVNIPGRGSVFVPDDKPQTTPQPTQPTQSTQPVQQTAKPTPPAPKPVVDVDPKVGLNIKDFAEPMTDAQGNVTGYRIRANVGFDESNRPTVRGFHGSQGEVRIWKPGEGYRVFGTEQKLREFARSHGHELPRGDLATLMQKGEITIPTTQTKQPSTQNLKNLSAAGLAAAGSVAGAALTQGVQAATDVLGMMGTTPAPKDRMQIEKDYGSDVGLGFNLTPEGELEADPQGMEAARKRQQSGVNFPSMFRG